MQGMEIWVVEFPREGYKINQHIQRIFFSQFLFQCDDKNRKGEKKMCFSENLCLENRFRILPKKFVTVKELRLEAGSRKGCEVLEPHERR